MLKNIRAFCLFLSIGRGLVVMVADSANKIVNVRLFKHRLPPQDVGTDSDRQQPRLAPR